VKPACPCTVHAAVTIPAQLSVTDLLLSTPGWTAARSTETADRSKPPCSGSPPAIQPFPPASQIPRLHLAPSYTAVTCTTPSRSPHIQFSQSGEGDYDCWVESRVLDGDCLGDGAVSSIRVQCRRPTGLAKTCHLSSFPRGSLQAAAPRASQLHCLLRLQRSCLRQPRLQLQLQSDGHAHSYQSCHLLLSTL
jgi:hypothetical protein